MSRLPIKGYIVFIHDIVMAGVSFVLSLYLRFGNELADYEYIFSGTLLFVGVAALVFWFSRLYGGMWLYASLNDLVAITKAVSLTILIYFALMFLVTRLEALPRSTLLINWFVLLILLGGPRFFYRFYKDKMFDFKLDKGGIPVLLVGAGNNAELFLRALNHQAWPTYQVLGMLSRDPGLNGGTIHGIRVLGQINDLEKVVDKLERRGRKPHKLIVTIDDMKGQAISQLLEKAEKLGLTLAGLPKLTELKADINNKVEPRPVVLEDLLGRPQNVLDREAMRQMIEGKKVLITGAGGTIGSELTRQIAGFRPAEIILLESSEFNLYSIDMELANNYPPLSRQPLLADVRDRERLFKIMAEFAPDLVFHAAALKHVPMVEINPFEGMLTNAIGSRNVADAALAAKVKAMVVISTDKAVNPTNIMGASKRIAECCTQALDGLGQTRFITVRFGNVLGSSGSVVPLFQRQLAAGGPLTVTHPEITRFFMTVREAVELVLQAATLGLAHDDYRGKIFVLDMGEPVKIDNLARQMIRLAGLHPDRDVKIVYTGLRPGEKLYEEVLHNLESTIPTACKGILVASPRSGDLGYIKAVLDSLEQACRNSDNNTLRQIIGDLVPEYQEPSHQI